MPLTLTPNVSVSPFTANVGFNNSWIAVHNNQNRPLFAQATYDVNYASESGQNGANFFNSTSLSAGNWYAIQMIADTTFTGLTGNWGGDVVNNTVSFKAGTIIYGNFTGIKLATGTAIAYNI
jgi:hypothetical protein